MPPPGVPSGSWHPTIAAFQPGGGKGVLVGGVSGLTPTVSLCSAVFLVTYLVLACCQGPR